MSGLDAGFFFGENDKTPLQIASVAVFEGEPPSYDDLVRLILTKLPQVPRYRQRVRTIPLNIARPVWVDDQHFQIHYHVRHAAVPPPGDTQELRNLVGRILAQRLDFSRPLWEAWLIEGLQGGRWAVISKTHHCMMDGIGGSDLMTLMFGLSPDEGPPPEPVPWTPDAEPSTASLVLDGVRATVGESLRQVADIPRLAGRLASDEVADFTNALPEYASRLTYPGPPALNGPASPHRRWWLARTELEEVKRTRRAIGVKVNDVILAAVARGFRDLLRARGVLSADSLVRTMVPVSIRARGQDDMMTNRVSMVLVNLPCGEPDPLRRLELVRAQMASLKASHQEVGPDTFVRLIGMAPVLLPAIARAIIGMHQPVIHAVTTNVPGPPIPLYVLGRKLVEVYPYVPIATGFRVSIGIVSYLGGLFFGLTGDFDAMPDIDVLGDGIIAGIHELAQAAESATPVTGEGVSAQTGEGVSAETGEGVSAQTGNGASAKTGNGASAKTGKRGLTPVPSPR
ncbi:MAG: WS/DGAT/MGAT family O-acyltransferase [Micromonosporaceae bacterium]